MQVRLHNPANLNEAFTLAVRADAVIYTETRGRHFGGDRPARDRDSRPRPMQLGAIETAPARKPKPDKRTTQCFHCGKTGH